MKFVLNTAIDPHFCALLDEKECIFDIQIWENRRLDGKETWAFLEKHKDITDTITFLGGVSGPGGFSSLRATSGILEALSAKLNTKIHHVRSDEWMKIFLEKENIQAPIVLNSFSQKVFLAEESVLTPYEAPALAEKLKDTPVYGDTLPEKKQELFTLIQTENKPSALDLYKALKKSTPSEHFLPSYEYAAVL